MEFDVFISFKNSDSNGARTQDSVMAEELYFALKKKGVNAFYSNISITEKGEHRFGNMINNALEQSDIFVAVGTSNANLNSDWVKYEIECFNGELLNGNKTRGKSAMFSFITKDVATNKMPMELRRCQAFTSLDAVVSSICVRLGKNETAPEDTPRNDSVLKTYKHYRILNKIEHDGMKDHYLAMDTVKNELRTVKFVQRRTVEGNLTIHRSLSVKDTVIKMLSHPALPHVVDVTETDDGFVVVRDYVEGATLEEYVRKKGFLPEKSVINLAIQLCEALIYLHNINPSIIQRFLKPSNVIIKPDGKIALISYDIAVKYESEDNAPPPDFGYVAPEARTADAVPDVRSDVYAVGAIVYYLATAKIPDGLSADTAEARQINGKLSEGLEYIIRKCTLSGMDYRYRSVVDVRDDLYRVTEITADLTLPDYVADSDETYDVSGSTGPIVVPDPEPISEPVRDTAPVKKKKNFFSKASDLD